MVAENKSPRVKRMMKEAIANGLLMENGQKWSNLTVSGGENGHGNGQKRSDLTENHEGKKTIPDMSDFPSIVV